jgi:hypothetical protein
VEQAVEIKGVFLEALDSYAQVVVSVSMVEGVDLAILQLIRSCALEAHNRGKVFHLTGTVRPELSRILLSSGFIQRPKENARDLEEELFGLSLAPKRGAL